MQKIITVINNDRNNGAQKSLQLDTESTMDKVRQKLTSKDIMRDSDAFLHNNSEFDRSDESETTLSIFLGDGETLIVGHDRGELNPASPDRTVDSFRNLSAAQKRELLDKVQLFRGLIFSEKGFERSSENVISYDLSKLKITQPLVTTYIKSDYSFSEVTHQMKVSSVQSASASLDTPYGGGEAEYKREKTQSSGSSKVKEYLLAKYLVEKIELEIPVDAIFVADEFHKAVKAAVEGDVSVNSYVNLLNVFHDWGYYVPSTFHLGGSLYSTEQTEISKFEEAETNKEEFSASFKASFEGIGGGGGYSEAHSTEKSTTSTSKFTSLTINQIGGLPGTTDDYNKWMISLDSAENWEIASFNRLVPTLALLWTKDQPLVFKCLKIIKQYYSYESVVGKQPVLNMKNYAHQIDDYNVPPF